MGQRDLEDYGDKRDSSSTPEPSDGGADADGRRFVIQKHDASTLHYDFRLEVDGVLESWAVPKGLSTDPSEKRLAMPTEDHPIDYVGFEGVIPEDEYGGGTVLVWDTGTYENRTADDDGESIPMSEAYEHGHISVDLRGEKLTGGYALTRTDSGGDARWLLVKKDDEAADAGRIPTSTEPRSVVSARTMEEIAAEKSHDD